MRFPPGFRCPEEVRAIYPEIEDRVLPIIKCKAKKLTNLAGWDFDDAIQEGRLALLQAIIKFDFNKGRGRLEGFIGRIVDKAFTSIWCRETAMKRCPRWLVEDEMVPYNPVSLESSTEENEEHGSHSSTNQRRHFPQALTDHDTPESLVLGQQELAQVRLFKATLYQDLYGLEADVFGIKINPPFDFLIMVRNTGGLMDCPTNVDIARYLGVTKNMVDYAIFKIRNKYKELIAGGFSGNAADAEDRNMQAVVHISYEDGHDFDFIKKVLAARGLEPKPLEDAHQRKDYNMKVGDDFRMIERYRWGCILFLRFQGQCCTAIIEGNFNPTTGEVVGSSQTRSVLPVSWYLRLVERLGGKS